MAGPADGVEQSGPAELVGHGDRVGRLALGVQGADGVEDVAVGGLVEVVGRAALDAGGDGVAAEQHGAEQGLLGLEVVGRDPAGGGAVGASPLSGVVQCLYLSHQTLSSLGVRAVSRSGRIGWGVVSPCAGCRRCSLGLVGSWGAVVVV